MWYDILGISPDSTQEEIQDAYNKVINDPIVSADRKRIKEARAAYQEGLARINYSNNREAINKQIIMRLSIFFGIIGTLVAIGFYFNIFDYFNKAVTIEKCLVDTRVDSSRLDVDNITSTLEDNDFIISDTKLVGSYKHIYAGKQYDDVMIGFTISTNRSETSCTLTAHNQKEVTYKGVDANFTQVISLKGNKYSSLLVRTSVFGANAHFEPEDIIDEIYKTKNFTRDFSIDNKSDYPELEEYLDEDYYFMLNDTLFEEYTNLTK